MNPFRGIIASFVERSLCEDQRGRTVFFPWWQFSQGYILPDAGFTRALVKLLSGYFTAFLIFLLLYALFGSLFAFYPETVAGSILTIVGTAAVWAAAYWFLANRVIRDLKASPDSYQDLVLNRAMKKRR